MRKQWMAVLLAGIMAVSGVIMTSAEELTDGKAIIAEGGAEQNLFGLSFTEPDNADENIIAELYDRSEEEVYEEADVELLWDGIYEEKTDEVDSEEKDVESEEELYEVGVSSGTCGPNLTWLLNNGVLTISGIGVMKDWDYISAAPWVDERKSIRQVIIESGVSSIGFGAFIGCENLTSVMIPNSVTSIGEMAFLNCISLTNVMMPNSVTSIGRGIFNGCKNLKNVTLSNRITNIGLATFANCTSLKSVTIPNSVTSIEASAFCDCTSLTSLTIPNSVTSIGMNTFARCTSLASIKIPNSVTSIESSTFVGCTGLRNMTIPNSITSIGDRAFSGCTSLKSMTIPNSVKSIGFYAFEDCCGLNTITFTGNAPSIDSLAFYGVTARAYYPIFNSSWTASKHQNYSGKLTWISKEIAATVTGCYNSVKGADIHWSKVDGATGYILYRKRSADGVKKVATIKNNSTTQYFDGEIKDNCWGRVYTYFVCTMYDNKEGPKSNEVTLQRLAPMKFTQAVNTAGRNFTLKWTCTTSSNKANGYELQYAASKSDLFAGNGKNVQFDKRNKLSTSSNSPGRYGQTYYFRIRAYVLYTNSKTGKQTKTWSQFSDVVSVKITR